MGPNNKEDLVEEDLETVAAAGDEDTGPDELPADDDYWAEDAYPDQEEFLAEDDYTEEDEFDDRRASRSPLLRVVAFITALAFLSLALATAFPRDRSLIELVQNSFQLKKTVDRQLMEAVVRIDVVAHQPGTITAERKLGTGFNIDPGGLIITNHHVIEHALNMSITFPDGQVYRAEHWVSRPETDLAVIALQGENLPAAAVDFSVLPMPGEKIRVVGNPLQLNNILVDGKVEQYLLIRDHQGKIFSIDAPIYPGNSGSPVYNTSGQAVGVIFGLLQSADSEDVNAGGQGLAVALFEAQNMVNTMLAKKEQEG